jgi:hypothetical protein
VSWNKGVLDPTGAQMVLTLKLISTAMCLQDFYEKKPQVRGGGGGGGGRGGRGGKGVNPGAPGGAGLQWSTAAHALGGAAWSSCPLCPTPSTSALPPQDMSPYQRTHHISRLPSLLEFLGYVFCFGNLLAGPIIEFKDYQSFIRHEGLWDPRAARKVPVIGCVIQVRVFGGGGRRQRPGRCAAGRPLCPRQMRSRVLSVRPHAPSRAPPSPARPRACARR